MRRSSGFSLVEVIIALALLGSVAIAMSGLYILGARHVGSGRSHSKALAAARDVLEEMNGWGFDRTCWQFGAGTGAVPVTDPPIDTRYNAFAKMRWQDALDRDLSNAHAEITLQSLPVAAGIDLEDADAIRIVVTVYWNEGPRERRASVAMVRM
ncbi:MAG: prepilin-type N-terminal cleavage/methylation domain-containing protein [bacterium]|nr:prepilin-type N-terminal cleavage/methylation domain-containing protein [bacterium]